MGFSKSSHFTAVALAGVFSLAVTQDIEPAMDTTYTQYGVHPDCSERAFSYAELIDLADSPKIKDQQDFLDRIPADSMQTFTLIYESESAQASGISPDFPGVIRMTQDGKLVFRYTCDRTKRVYNKVEVIHFDEEKAQFKFTEIAFSGAPGERVKNDPRKCYNCHNQSSAVADARPNWAMYPDWSGIFGSHDDFFPRGNREDVARVAHAENWLPPNREKEKADFDRFVATRLRNADPDPCYATLPFVRGEAIPAKFANYPYDVHNGHARDRIYALRPNLKFTEIFSHLLGIRNARRIQAAPQFADLKRLLAVEAARCLDQTYGGRRITSDQLHAYLKEVLGNYVRPQAAEAKTVSLRGNTFTYFDPRHPTSLAQGVYGASIALGFAPGDWTLTFGEAENAAFEPGAGPGQNSDFSSDLPISAYVQHEILAAVAGAQLDVARLFSRSTGESDDFGPHFSCIDAIAGATVFESDDGQAKLCTWLVDETLRFREEFLARPKTRQPPPSRGVPPSLPRPFNRKRDDLKKLIQQIEQED